MNVCGHCGRELNDSRAKFCDRDCYVVSRKGIQPPQIKKIPKGGNVHEIEDGSIDAGLLLMSIIPKPNGGVWSSNEVAAVCGTTGSYIRKLEQTAIRKLRTAFLDRMGKQNLEHFL